MSTRRMDEWRWGDLPSTIEGLLSPEQRDELARDLADMAKGRRLAEMNSAEIVMAAAGFNPRDGVLTPGWKRCGAVMAALVNAADPCPEGCAIEPDVCGWPLGEWDRCTRPADHEGACA